MGKGVTAVARSYRTRGLIYLGVRFSSKGILLLIGLFGVYLNYWIGLLVQGLGRVIRLGLYSGRGQ